MILYKQDSNAIETRFSGEFEYQMWNWIIKSTQDIKAEKLEPFWNWILLKFAHLTLTFKTSNYLS